MSKEDENCQMNENSQKSTQQRMSQSQEKHQQDPQQQISVEGKFRTLCSMFQVVDPEVIRLVLIEECDGNMDYAVEALLIVTGGSTHSPQQDVKEEKVKVPRDDTYKYAAILIMDNLWQHRKLERERSIKLLAKVYKNIKLNPNDAKYPITQFIEESIRLLIESVTNRYVKGIPEYIADTFNHIRMSTKILSIDMYTLSNEIHWKNKNASVVYYGGKILKDVYFDQNDNIKWPFIKLLFPNLTGVQIRNTLPKAEEYEISSLAESILLTDDVLNEILHFLKDSQVDSIYCMQPQNNVYSMEELRARFGAKYEKIGYDLTIGENRGPDKCQDCTLFAIERKSNNLPNDLMPRAI